ncbi:hypothetical protein Scep_003943 [Stephania cephalantha]|uniref:Uncharacterized protein n=1 Tax=Stephania cephalantha TaxID=152367 RepID=A0AAP0KT22_9MAGN
MKMDYDEKLNSVTKACEEWLNDVTNEHERRLNSVTRDMEEFRTSMELFQKLFSQLFGLLHEVQRMASSRILFLYE